MNFKFAVMTALVLSTSAFAADGKAFLADTGATFSQAGPLQADDLQAVLAKSVTCTVVDTDGKIGNRSLQLYKEAPNLYKDVVDTSMCGIVACISNQTQQFRLNESGELVAVSGLTSQSYINGTLVDNTEIRIKRAPNGDWVGQLYKTKKQYVFWGAKYEKPEGYMYCNAVATAQAAAAAAQPAQANVGQQKAPTPTATEDGSSNKKVAQTSEAAPKPKAKAKQTQVVAW